MFSSPLPYFNSNPHLCHHIIQAQKHFYFHHSYEFHMKNGASLPQNHPMNTYSAYTLLILPTSYYQHLTAFTCPFNSLIDIHIFCKKYFLEARVSTFARETLSSMIRPKKLSSSWVQVTTSKYINLTVYILLRILGFHNASGVS